MAKRDYVTKGRAPTKRNNSSNKRTTTRKTSARNPFPWKAAIIAVLLVAALIAGLNMLSNAPEPEKAQPIKVTPKPPTVEQKKNVIPPPPEEKWDYMETLPNREVEVEAKEQQVSKIPYVMQCGAYKALGAANERKANIAFQGLASKVVRSEGSSWYRIILGPYRFKRDAVKHQHVLQRAKIEPCMIMKDTMNLVH